VTNGVGTDVTELADMSVVGNVVVQNGAGGALGNAGHTWIRNPTGPGRAVIGGNVSVTYKDGDVTTVPDELLDVQVMGNVTFAHGRGNSDTVLAGDQTALPAIVRATSRSPAPGRRSSATTAHPASSVSSSAPTSGSRAVPGTTR